MKTSLISRLSTFVKTVILAYIFSLIAIALTTGALFYFRGMINSTIVALLYLLPVMLSAAFGGLGPGIVAAFLAFLAFNYFFIPPLYTLRVHQTQDLLVLVVFLIAAFTLSQALGTAKKNLAAARAREREAIQLYELSSELAKLLDDQAVLQTLANKIMETFQPQRLELFLERSAEREPILLSLNSSLDRRFVETGLSQKPDLLVPLHTSGGMQGEIRIWRHAIPLSSSENRLMQIFASQCVIALERALFIQAEKRARILEESDRLKSSLLSSVSHELRTPLAAIKASASGLRSELDALDSEARDELLAAIEEETDHLNLLVGNLLDMSRIEAGVLKPQRAWNALQEIVTTVLKRIHASLQNHSLIAEIPDDLPLVPVDYVQIEQVFTNLISNSIKYSPPGTKIWITAQEGPGPFITVQVRNQGPPVAEEHLERIFDKFYRVTATDRITGAGLGLSICKGIIQAHDGRIWAANLPSGLAYNFTLPLTWEGAPPRIPTE